MDALILRTFGRDGVTLEERPLPSPGDEEVLVRIHAASLNPVDYKIRDGFILEESHLPMTLGRDFAGTVEFCGRDAGALNLGDRVFGLTGYDRGTFADYVITRQSEVARLPFDANLIAAAALPLAALTAWQGLIEYGEINDRQRVLILGGSGGVGHLATQIAHALGAYVVVTASPSDMRFLEELGADEVVDFRHDRFEDRLEKVDLVLDLIGGEAQERAWNLLAPNGRMVSTVEQPRAERAAQYDRQGLFFMTRPNADQLAHIAALFEDGRLRAHLEGVYPLSHWREAMTRLEEGHVRGKLVLQTATTPTGVGG